MSRNAASRDQVDFSPLQCLMTVSTLSPVHFEGSQVSGSGPEVLSWCWRSRSAIASDGLGRRGNVMRSMARFQRWMINSVSMTKTPSAMVSDGRQLERCANGASYRYLRSSGTDHSAVLARITRNAGWVARPGNAGPQRQGGAGMGEKCGPLRSSPGSQGALRVTPSTAAQRSITPVYAAHAATARQPHARWRRVRERWAVP